MKNIKMFILLLSLPLYSWSQFSNPDGYKENWKPISNRNVKSASTLLNQYDQKFVFIDLAANDSNTYIDGSVKYLLQAKNQGIDTIYFEFAPDLTIDSIQINNQHVSYYHSQDTILVFSQNTLPQGSSFWVQVWYHGLSTTGGQYRGLTNTWSNIYNVFITWTLSESFHLKDWLPCKQDLTDKLDSAWIFITVDSTLKAGSNGKLTQIAPKGSGKVCYEWKTHHTIDYYLLSLAVGKYYEYDIYAHPAGYADSIFIQNYIYNTPQCISDNLWLIDKTPSLINLFSEKFGLYPWADEKFGHSMCPVGGGMENQTMTSLGYFDTWLIAHELSHQWFGDRITCASWQDIWINEGFASYAEYIYAQNLVSQSEADVNMDYCHKKSKFEPTGSVYVPFSEIWNEGRIFNQNLTYKKGSAIIHMLRYLCGNDTLFYNALKQMVIQYADSVITGEDVKHVFENITGKSFEDFFNQYYYGEGFPIYTLKWQQDSSYIGFGDLKIQLEQHGSSVNNPLFTIPIQIKVSFASKPDSIIVIYPNQNVSLFQVNINGSKIDSLTFDPQNWVLDSLQSIEQLVQNIEWNNFIISLYPNPASDNIYFQYSGPDNFKGEINIYDLSGRVVLTHVINSNTEIIPVTNIKPGMYLTEIKGNHITLVRKELMIQ